MRCADKPCQCCARPMTEKLLVFSNDEKGLGFWNTGIAGTSNLRYSCTYIIYTRDEARVEGASVSCTFSLRPVAHPLDLRKLVREVLAFHNLALIFSDNCKNLKNFMQFAIDT